MSLMYYLSFLALSTCIALTSTSFFMIWVSMEMSILVLMPILTQQKVASMNESALKYFLIQISAGLIFLASAFSSQDSNTIILLAMAIKLGIFPFYIWIPHIFSGFSFYQIFILSTIQKIPPLTLVAMIYSNPIVLIILTILIGSLSGIFLANFKKMLAYSSISHTGWLVAISKFFSSWTLYLGLYMIILFMTMKFFHNAQMKSITQSNLIFSSQQSLYFWLLIISLAGLPPFMGFYLKWLSLTFIIVLMFSLTLFFYLAMFISNTISMSSKNSNKLFFKNFVSLSFNSVGLIFLLPLLFN